MKCDCQQDRNPPCFCTEEDKDPAWLVVLSYVCAIGVFSATALFVFFAVIQLMPVIQLL